MSSALLFFGALGKLGDDYIDENTRAQVVSRLKTYLDNLLQAVDSSGPFFSTLIMLLFWLAVGAVLYMLFWILFSAIKDYFYEVEVSLFFVHPNSFKESKHWLAVIGRGVFKFATTLVIIAYSIFLIKVVYPALVDEFTSGLSLLSLKSIAVETIGSIILMSAGLYILSLFIRLLFPKPAIEE